MRVGVAGKVMHSESWSGGGSNAYTMEWWGAGVMHIVLIIK